MTTEMTLATDCNVNILGNISHRKRMIRPNAPMFLRSEKEKKKLHLKYIQQSTIMEDGTMKEATPVCDSQYAKLEYH